MRLQRFVGPDLGRIFRGETVSGLSEWQLLERYLERRDEAAFEAIVRRHGPMVLGVCRRMLRDTADVEDAFQATFLVLVRRARQLGPRDAIGAWLYGVAARVALRARSQQARRRQHEPAALEFPVPAPAVGWIDPDLGEVLDQELSRLPSKYRSPLVLCYLEGRTHEEAARELNWPVGTVKGRLARARDLLRSRLTRRGLAPTAGVLATLAVSEATAGLERPLIERTVSSSLKFVAGQSLAQVVSQSITSLVQGVLTAMFLNKLKWAGISVLVAGFALSTAGVMARQDAPTKAAPPSAAAKPEPRPAVETAEAESADAPRAEPSLRKAELAVDPRQELIQAARSAYQSTWEAYRAGQASAEQVDHASQKWMEAQGSDSSEPQARLAAAVTHYQRMRELLRVQADRPGSPARPAELARIKAYVAEARFLVAQARTRPAVKDGPGKRVAGGAEGRGVKGNDPFDVIEMEGQAGGGEGRGKDPRSRQIIAKLEEPISMSFANETPLDDVLKYIKQATTTPTYSGIPIYVDPIGLQEAERSTNSTVQIDLEGVPLRRTLQLILSQLGLVYFVDDGMLVITSQDSEHVGLPPSMQEQSPILQRAAKAERGELTKAEMEELIEEFKLRATVMKYAKGEGLPAHEEGSKPDHQQMEQLLKEVRALRGAALALPEPAHGQINEVLKEIRELVEQLKAERPAKKATQ